MSANGAPQRGLPRHVAIIMDGNGRWAQQRGLLREAGHERGTEALRRVVRACVERGIPYLTVYAFSTENWERPRREVAALMRLLDRVLVREVDELAARGVRVQVLGRRDGLSRALLHRIERACRRTEANGALVLSVAWNYGGRAEIVDAARALAREVAAGRLEPEAIDEALFAGRLYSAGIPDPDLVIRTGGEYRISNFLLWQVAYAELWVTPVLWPDFTEEHLDAALDAYRRRSRRFGRVLDVPPA
ncbi:isoprenyl transferase [Limnochorda pilosa]|uniref:Isoprenyl transferase n=1 Tax=Limnochorda pilosa TaxID=1555112 RepID=A0A0K2SKI2_LIMPI|nr:isoprenyl transferase [Limnochorda pilosa]BAS27527.1 UDP pyrophosphate synthase [Limnochorda pilosa]